MERAARAVGQMTLIEPSRHRGGVGPVVLMLEVTDPETALELRRHAEGEDREQFALAALKVGVLSLRAASGQVDVGALREAGGALVAEMRDLLSARAAEMTERLGATLTQYLDPQSGALPARLHALVKRDGELDQMLRAHVGGDDSLLARSLAAHLGQGSAIFQMLSPTDANGLRAQLQKTLEDALAEQRQHILREFSLDDEGSALSRMAAEFSLDDEGSAMSRLSRMMTATSERIGRDLTLDDEGSSLSRLKRELLGTIEQLSKSNVEFHAQVREAMAKLDTRRKEEALTPRHGVTFEERLGALLAEEAQRLGDIFEATGDTTGVIRSCKKGDYVMQLGADSAAANARIVWEAKEKNAYALRAALAEIDEARRNRQAQVGVFVFSRKTAPEGLESLQRHGNDVVVVWDADEPTSDLLVRAAYSLARALAVRERRSDKQSEAALAELERAARGVERQIGYLDDVRRWVDTIKASSDKIADRTTRMAEDLRRDVERLDAQIARMRTDAEAG